MTLAIDSRDPSRTRLVLLRDGRLAATTDVTDKDALLAGMDRLLARHGGVGALRRIGVVTGGGSFSGVRQAVVLARTIAWAAGIPARAFAWKGEEPTPREARAAGKPLTRVAYSGTPNITKPKSRSARSRRARTR